MTTSTVTEWYCRTAIDGDDDTPVLCPRCRNKYFFGPIFDHHPRECHNCHTALREWFLFSAIYIIDTEKAPDIVKALIKHLDTLGEPEAFEQLSTLLSFLGIAED